MNQRRGVELNYLPLCGKMLSVAMKEVSSDNRTELPLCGNSEGDLAGDSVKATTAFSQTMENPNRITIHFQRKWENDSLPMLAACRMKDRDRQTGEMKDGKPFGFSLETKDKKYEQYGQFFLNLVYLSPEKPEGFEPLYLKMRQKDGRGQWQDTYLKISLMRANKILTVVAEKVSGKDVPDSLRLVNFQKPASQPDPELLRAFVGSKFK